MSSDMPLTDTPPAITQMQIDILRRMPVPRKLQLVAEMNETLRVVALAGLRCRHPGADEAQLRRRLADLLLGSELAARVYGPLPEDDRC
jgi:hypothetical protein